jgi:iron complex outermembrane receptor protein
MQQEIAEKLTLNAGLRYQYNSENGNNWIPSAGFAWKLSELTTWKGSVSEGFRSPTMRELFLWGPNPNLEPESIICYETGISRFFFNRKMSAEVTVYSLNGDNIIVNIPMKGFQNSGKVNNKGIELAITTEPIKNLSINATYSFINMEAPVYATPEHHLFLEANYRYKKWQVNAYLQQISNLDNDPSPKVNLESYTLLNTKISFDILKGLKVFASGENLLSQEYEVNRYYPMPGVTWFTGLNFSF